MRRGVAHEDPVEEDLSEDVQEVDRREGDFVHEDWADGVEEDLEGAEECFSEQGVEEQRFERCREVGV